MTTYYTDYPKRKMSKPNPYYCCFYCGKTDPYINGRLDKHEKDCEYRIIMELRGFKDERFK